MCAYIYICIHVYINIHIISHKLELSAINKNEIMSFVGKWMELEVVKLSKVSQVQKDKGHMFSVICGR
jgi:hypothetical protein